MNEITVPTRVAQVRCPFCMLGIETSESAFSRNEIQCSQCRKTFMVRDALPCKTASDIAPVSSEHDELGGNSGLIIALALVSLIGLSACFIGHDWSGIKYLFFYGLTFFVLLISSLFIRSGFVDLYIISVVHFLVFEAIGAARLHYGLTHDMHRFAFLIIMMLLGGACFFLRSKTIDGGSYGLFGGCGIDFGSGGGCGSGCGGGGCGGGCGGCGG